MKDENLDRNLDELDDDVEVWVDEDDNEREVDDWDREFGGFRRLR
jgi:hypothetical protein